MYFDSKNPLPPPIAIIVVLLVALGITYQKAIQEETNKKEVLISCLNASNAVDTCVKLVNDF